MVVKRVITLCLCALAPASLLCVVQHPRPLVLPRKETNVQRKDLKKVLKSNQVEKTFHPHVFVYGKALAILHADGFAKFGCPGFQ